MCLEFAGSIFKRETKYITENKPLSYDNTIDYL